MEINVNNDIRIKLADLPEPALIELKSRLRFKNPAYQENIKYGRWNGNTPELLYFIWCDGDYAVIPRGFIYQFMRVLAMYGIKYTIKSGILTLPEVSFSFKGNLHHYQKKAVTAILSKNHGVLHAPTGSGKTVIALKAITERIQPALVVVHTKELLHQWKQRAIEYLGLSEKEIGLIGEGKKTVGKQLTIGIINSLVNSLNLVKDKVGFLIIDECHHCPSKTFTDVVSEFNSAYMLGLSATPYRRDGLTRVIYFYLGDKIHEIESKVLQDSNHVITATLEVVETGFDYPYNDDYSAMITALTKDTDRNALITETVLNNLDGDNGIALVLSERKEHCLELQDRLLDHRVKAALLLGDTGTKERKQTIAGLNAGAYKALVATSSLIGEGFDLPAISSIFLTTPVKFQGRLTQYVGRALRTAKGKTGAKVFDFVDLNGVLQASFRSRLHTYERLGVII
ncbi:MAG: DEAD/DEAH box helicase [Nitrospirae bacterium YQR-1]